MPKHALAVLVALVLLAGCGGGGGGSEQVAGGATAAPNRLAKGVASAKALATSA
jgi:hypothetical protein